MAKKPNIGKSISKATKSTTKAVAKTAAPVAKTVAKTAAPVAAPVAKATTAAAKTVAKTAAPVATTVAKTTTVAAKTVGKATAPVAAAVAKTATTSMKTVAKTATTATNTVAKTATVAAAGTAAIAKKAVPAPAQKKEDDKYKKMYEDCNKTSDMQRTEITNLKYRITAADNDKKDLLSQVNTMNFTISNQKNEIGALNTKVNVLDRRINGPLVQVSGKNSTNKKPNNSVGSKISSSIKKMFGIKKPKSNKKGKKNNFTGHMEEDDDEQQMEEGFQEGAEDLTSIYRGKPKEVYDITPGTSTGLEPAATNYGTLYNTYYKGYEDSQTLIQDVLEPEVKYLQTVEVKDIKYAYAAVQQQNKTLESQINETADEYSTDFQRAKYVEEQVESVKMRNAIMFFLYYILFFVFAFLLFTGGSDMSMKMKVGVLLIVFTYPYWIAYLSSLTSFVYNYSVALFRGVPYEPSLK